MTPLSTAAQIALVLLGALAVVGVIVLVVLLVQLRRVGRELERRAGPLLEKSSVVAGNLEYITAQIRTDVERLNDSVASLTSRLNQASDHMEDRIEEFNALMEVVQGEAEDVFLDTAATVRGIRAGARSLAEPGGGPGRRDRDRQPDRELTDGSVGGDRRRLAEGADGGEGTSPDPGALDEEEESPTEPDPARERSA